MVIDCQAIELLDCLLRRNKIQSLNQRENRLRDSLGKFITLHKARAVYYWEVGADTKLYPDLALGNSLCLCGCKPKSEKPLFFSWPPTPLKNELLPWG
jgi:hypothetical protein